MYGQTDLNPNAVTNLPIMAGSWYIDNVFAALDMDPNGFMIKIIIYYIIGQIIQTRESS